MFEFLRRSSPLWRHASFNRLWAAQALSAFGSRITRTAIPIIAVSSLNATPGETAILSAASFAPVVLAGFFGGGFVERSNKLRLMVALDLIRFAVVLAPPVAFVLGVLSFPLLCAMAMAAGFASALFQNADVSILPRLVGKAELVEANSRLQATESIAELTGPGAAGVLIDLLTAPFAMIVDALTFLWSACWLARIPREAGQAPVEEPIAGKASPLATLRTDLVVGFRAIVHRKPLRAILGATGIYYVSAGFFFATYMIFMLRTLDLTPAVIGLIISLGGASALAGSVLARPMSERIGFGPALILGFVLATLGTLMLIPAAMAPQWSLVFLPLQQLLGDGGIMVFTVLGVSLQQRLLPEDVIARANGLNQAVSGIGMFVSILAAGAIAETIGVASTVMLGAGLCVLAIFPLLSPSLLGMRKPPQAPEGAEAAA